MNDVLERSILLLHIVLLDPLSDGEPIRERGLSKRLRLDDPDSTGSLDSVGGRVEVAVAGEDGRGRSGSGELESSEGGVDLSLSTGGEETSNASDEGLETLRVYGILGAEEGRSQAIDFPILRPGFDGDDEDLIGSSGIEALGDLDEGLVSSSCDTMTGEQGRGEVSATRKDQDRSAFVDDRSHLERPDPTKCPPIWRDS